MKSRTEGAYRQEPSAVAVNALDNGVTGDGTTNDRAALQALITACAGQRPIRLPAGRYRLGTGAVGTNRITLPSNTHILGDPGAVIEVNQVDNQSGASTFYAAGTDGAKANMTGDTAAGALSLTLPTGQGATFAWGDLIGIEAQTSAGNYDSGPFYVREVRRVMRVAGDVVHLDAPLDYAYTTAATAQFWKITPVKNITFEGLVFEPGPGVTPGTDGTYAISLVKALNCKILGAELHHMIGGLRLFDAYDTTVEDPFIDSLPLHSSPYGYGLQAAASTTNLKVSGMRARDCRHAFTTIADERAGSVFWGGPMHVQVADGIGYGGTDSLPIWDTHEFGRHIHFDNCMAIGGGAAVSGFQIRGQDILLSDCRAIRCGLQGAVARKDSRNVRISGGEFSRNGTAGVGLLGADGALTDARVHGNGGAGVNINATTSVDAHIVDNKITDNTLYGILDGGASGSTRPIMQNNYIPQSAAQTSAIAMPSATAVIQGGIHTGYGANQHGIVTPTVGCRIHGVICDSGVTGNQLTALGAPTSVNPDFTALLSRNGSAGVRTDSTVRVVALNLNGGPSIFTGAGSPEGAVTAAVGSTYHRTSDGAVWRKTSGAGNTGWVTP